MERPSVAPNPGRSGVLLGNNSSTTQSDVAPEKILFEHYKKFISETYPDKRKTELVCPFLRLHPEEYEHITTSGCQKNGFDDVSRLKTHIDRTHVQGQVADENKRGPRVPMIDTVQGLHNWRAYKKDRTGVNSKKNPKDTATKWWDLARNSADPHAQPCGHRDDFHLDFPGSDFQKFVKFMQWLKESGNGYLHLNEPQPQRPTTGNLPMATQDHRTFLNDRPESNVLYEPRPQGDSGYGSIGGQIEEEESRHGFPDCDIPKEYVNPADLMGAGSFASLDTGHDGDAMMSYIDFSSDPPSASS